MLAAQWGATWAVSSGEELGDSSGDKSAQEWELVLEKNLAAQWEVWKAWAWVESTALGTAAVTASASAREREGALAWTREAAKEGVGEVERWAAPGR